jgi:hypothetical protein
VSEEGERMGGIEGAGGRAGCVGGVGCLSKGASMFLAFLHGIFVCLFLF